MFLHFKTLVHSEASFAKIRFCFSTGGRGQGSEA